MEFTTWGLTYDLTAYNSRCADELCFDVWNDVFEMFDASLGGEKAGDKATESDKAARAAHKKYNS